MKRFRYSARMRALRRADRGQSLVEFVLALPILLVIVFGIIEFAAAWRTYQIITNVSREGARMAVLPTQASPLGDTNVTNWVNTLLTQSGLNPSSATLTLYCGASSGATCTPANVNSVGPEESVEIAYPHQFVVLGPVLDLMCAGCGTGYGTVTLRARTSMRNEGSS